LPYDLLRRLDVPERLDDLPVADVHEVEEPGAVVTVDQVRAFVADFPRSYEVLVHDRVKFRVGQIVYLAFSRDETVMSFAFPKEERHMLVETEPDKFMLPRESDMRFNWVLARCDALEEDEMRELVFDAWRMVVPKKVWTAFSEGRADAAAEPGRGPRSDS
jgi:hypothetical protein